MNEASNGNAPATMRVQVLARTSDPQPISFDLETGIVHTRTHMIEENADGFAVYIKPAATFSSEREWIHTAPNLQAAIRAALEVELGY